eukprot:TRINITY_DN6715_c0_g1_i3.p1 TRINITY_DN6715_c0_g1~~TRINITY_DN6715_c0_g1_i3.p1  ORF type:complete len:808 (-),score=160.56 TRINITY_DN6715_c0_g1_i3:68-2419(-)
MATPPESGRPFFLYSELGNNLVLDVQGGSQNKGAHLIIHPLHGGANQQFIYRDGFIRPVSNQNLVLDVAGGLGQGHDVIQWDPHGGVNQKFVFHQNGSIGVGNLVLDIFEGRNTPGTKVIVWSHHGGANQRWRVNYVNQSGTSPEEGRPFFLFSKLGNGLVLDVQGASRDRGAKLIVHPLHRGTNQQFIYTQGFIRPVSNPQLVLDVAGGLGLNHDIIQWDSHGGPNQKYIFAADGSIAVGNFVLDIFEGRATPGTRLIAHPHHGGANQKWSFEYVNNDTVLRSYSAKSGVNYQNVIHGHPRFQISVNCQPANQTLPDFHADVGLFARNRQTGEEVPLYGVNHWLWSDGSVYIWPVGDAQQYNGDVKARWDRVWAVGQNVDIVKRSNEHVPKPGKPFFLHSKLGENLVCDIAGGSTQPEAGLLVYTKHGGLNQQFTYDDGYLKPLSNPQLVLDVAGGVAASHNLIQYPPHGGPNQKFTFNHDGSIGVGGLVLDVFESRKAPGTKVISYPYHGGNNQKWSFHYVNDDPAPLRSYVVTSPIVYDGVIHGHPRFQIPCHFLPSTGSFQDYFKETNLIARNKATGEHFHIFGVNHWCWENKALYLWPVERQDQYKADLKAQWDRVFAIGQTLEIVRLTCETHTSPITPGIIPTIPSVSGSAPPPSVPSCHQIDGQYWVAIAHSPHGDIPAKAKGADCWYPYGGGEHTCSSFSWVNVPGHAFVKNTGTGVRPSNAIYGKQKDGHNVCVAIAHTEGWGDVPGKADDNTCWYPYDGSEHTTSNFSWITHH